MKLHKLSSMILATAVVACAATTLTADDWSPLWSTATLSQARGASAAASAGDKVVFAGGGYGWSGATASNVVDIYNTGTGAWSATTLSTAREYPAAASVGNKVVIGGGSTFGANNTPSNAVDIFDTAGGTWSTANLSQPRCCLAAAAAGGEVFFGGGYATNGTSNRVDIYNAASGTWSTANLSQSRQMLAATSVGAKVLFAGGEQGGWSAGLNSDRVDIYDTASGMWSTATLSKARGYLAAASANGKALFGGGDNTVDIYDSATNTWSTTTLSQSRDLLAAASVGTKILFAGGYIGDGNTSSVVDIYDTATNTWSTSNLSQPGCGLSATSLGNKVYIGGGDSGNVVDIYTLQSYPTIASSKTFTLADNTTVAGRMQLSAPGSLSLATFNLNVGSMSGTAPIDLGNSTLTVGTDNTSTIYSGVISGAGNLTKTGVGKLTFAGADTFNSSGGIGINQGALTTPFGIPHGGSAVTLAGGATLEAGGQVKRAVSGIGTVAATADLIIGNSTQAGQFNQGGTPGMGGTLNVGGNAVAIFSADQAILGSQTNLSNGGSLTTLNGAQLGNPTSLDATKILTATGNATINGNFVNNGVVNGPTGSGQWLTFTQFVKGAGRTTGNIEYAGSYSPGNSPDAVSVQNVLLDSTSTLILELAGTQSGSGYDQLIVSGLATLDGALDVNLVNSFSPSAGESFDLFDGPTTGRFSQVNLPALSNGLSWDTRNLYTTGTISVAPEPSTLVLLGVGAISLLAYAWRQRRAL